MGFLKKRSANLENSEKQASVLEHADNVPIADVKDAEIKNAAENNAENDILAPSYVNLMGRLLRSHKAACANWPEIFFENEAWAPEAGQVGLFRKHRINSEDHLPALSDPQ